MHINGKEWSELEKGERISALEFAHYLTRMKWLRINLVGKKEQSTGLGVGRL
ncbi:hypothetical protein [Paenibacillus brevis]|uniref:Uncharacterized protein n=1 Tax=Paenibacillus brevis TaxID=2841508 RepID=A0ABS6FM78_9BACL|nr:hypothetical protein [Paenibacillus brevis]MBU5670275.1 hypothetical protein [Paenibacillus brevis]